jgi:CCR4-NOT complex subunit CAF16
LRQGRRRPASKLKKPRSPRAVPAVELRSLHFAYPECKPLFKGVSLEIPSASRTLLIGANGTGKSTLLRLIAGHHLLDRDALHVFGRSPFYDLSLSGEVSLVEGYFPLNVDLRVHELLAAPVQGVDRKLEGELRELLGINPDWRMAHVSEGQRRRVQLLLTLRRPIRVLLLDEVTSNLDVVIRADLLEWVRERSEKTGMTVIYATHVFDGLWQNARDRWLTHIALLRFSGKPKHHPIGEVGELKKAGASLFRLCENWIRSDILAGCARSSEPAAPGDVF